MHIKNIKSIIRLIAIGLFVYTLHILIIDRLPFLTQKASITSYTNRLNLIEEDLLRLNTLKSEFLLQHQQKNDAYGTADDEFENKTEEIIRKVKNELNNLHEVPVFNNDSVLSPLYRSFSKSFTSFSDELNNLVLAVRERGNMNTGLISQMLNISDQLLPDSLSDEETVNNLLIEIRLMETEYLQGYQTHYLEELANMLSNTIYSVDFEETGISSGLLDEYLTLANRLINANRRIQTSANEGFAPKVNIAFNTMLMYHSRLIAALQEKASRSSFLFHLLIYLYTFLIVVLFVYWFKRMLNNRIAIPLHTIHSYTQEIEKGHFPKKELSINTGSEFNQLSDTLNNILKKLKDQFSFLKNLNEGNYHFSSTYVDESDLTGNELLKMQKMIIQATEEQTKNDEQNMRRRYVNEGLAKFAEILRLNNDDIQLLADNFIKNTVKYLNAIQGGLFLMNENHEEHQTLSLTASFAYNRKKYQEKTIQVGEGLIGTCAIEKSVMNLTEIPEGYISITSGLGDTPPDNLLLVPVMHETEFIGVIEIASLNKFKDFEITFATEVAKSLGSSIISTRNNEKTNQLLTKSQQQALEMAEQEEEMRQNMEELKATQEESARREEEYKGIINAIDNSIFVIEYDLQGFIINANKKFCSFIGKKHPELKGKKHQQVFKGTLNPDELFWDTLKEATIKVEQETIQIGDKQHVLNENFSAVYNLKGDLIKFMSFVFEVSK